MSIKKSFSLMEVMIFVSILAVFLTISAAIITVSIRQNSLRINTLKATHYNEQLLDWLRNEKEAEWNAFANRGTTNGVFYCFNSEDVSRWPLSGSLDTCTYALDGIYRRYLEIENLGEPATQVKVKIHSDWQEAGNSYSSELNSVFTIWE